MRECKHGYAVQRILSQAKFATMALLAVLVVTYAMALRAQTDVPQAPMASQQRNDRSLALETIEPGPANGVEEQIRTALKQTPQSADLLYKLALVQRQEGKTQESLDTYTQAAALAKPDAEELRSVALDYVQLNDYDDAVRWLRVAHTLDSRNVEVLYSLGRCLYTQGLYPEAERAFKQALTIDPGHLKAEENLGLALIAENYPKQADEALRKAAQWAEQRHLRDPWPYADLGNFLMDQQQISDALPYLRKASELDPGSALFHQNLGRGLLAVGKYEEGIAELETAEKLAPRDPKIHFQLGHAYRDLGEEEKARVEFDLSKELYGQRDRN
jgi:tetratricopeptide (TPR) repeat protein